MHEQHDALRPTFLLVAAGDRAAFERLYDQAGAATFGVMSRVLPAHLAEETFIEFWTSVWADNEPLVRVKFGTFAALMGLAAQFAAHALHHRSEPS